MVKVLRKTNHNNWIIHLKTLCFVSGEKNGVEKRV